MSNSSQAEEDHAARYADECYANELEVVAYYVKKIEFNFQGAYFTDEEDLVSIEIITIDIKFRPLLKRSQEINIQPVDLNRLLRPKAKHRIKGFLQGFMQYLDIAQTQIEVACINS